MAIAVSDTFTRSADADLSAHTPDTGTGWTIIESTAATAVARVIASTDRVKTSASENTVHILAAAGPDPSGAEYDVQMTIAVPFTGTGTRSFGLFGRWQSSSVAGYAANLANGQASGNDRQLVRHDTGGLVVLAQTDGGEWTAGDVVTLEIRDATKRVLVNGSEILSSTDNTVTGAGKAGIHWGNRYGGSHIRADWEFDNFVRDDVSAAGVTANLTAGQAGQTVASAASVAVSGAVSVAQAGQTVAAAGSVAVRADLARTQAGQTLAASSSAAVQAALAAQQAGQTGASAASVSVSAALSATQAGQTVAAAGSVAVRADLSAQQAGQTLAATAGAPAAVLSLDAVQQGQTVASAASVAVSGALAAQQAGDTLAATMAGVDPVQADLSAAQAGQTVAASASVAVRADLSAQQAGDALAAAASALPERLAALEAAQQGQTLAATLTIAAALGGAVILTPAREGLIAVPGPELLTATPSREGLIYTPTA